MSMGANLHIFDGGVRPANLHILDGGVKPTKLHMWSGGEIDWKSKWNGLDSSGVD